MFINYAEIPGTRELFLDYLYNFEKVAKFYKKDFRNTSEYEKTFSDLKSYQRDNMKELVDILTNQYSELKPSKQTKKNIELLKSDNTIAIVTGQQLGIFGGPLYTLYKTITAIKLVNSLKSKYEEYNFVPVFWMEGDDHDFDEISSLKIVGENSRLEKIIYDDGSLEETNRGSVGSIAFNENLSSVLSTLDKNLRKTEFKEDLINLINSTYKSGNTFYESFRALLFNLFDEYGIVIINPVDPEIKKLLTPIFMKEIDNFNSHTKDIVETSAELDEIYHAQVKVKPINIFVSDESGRFLLEPVDDEFRLKGKRKKITKDDLFQLLEKRPEVFSPNVLMRPICQDYLLPTAFYIAGPSEISYFAQAIPLYEFFGIPQPIIYPRVSATIVEKMVKKIAVKYNLDYLDFFIDNKTLNKNVVNSLSEIDLNSLFQKADRDSELIFKELKKKLLSIDKTLNDVTLKSQQRVKQSFENLKSKSEKAQSTQHEAVLRQLNKAQNLIYPNDNLQERELNFIYFAHKYGMEIFKWIFNEMSINKFEHQIIEL